MAIILKTTLDFLKNHDNFEILVQIYKHIKYKTVLVMFLTNFFFALDYTVF